VGDFPQLLLPANRPGGNGNALFQRALGSVGILFGEADIGQQVVRGDHSRRLFHHVAQHRLGGFILALQVQRTGKAQARPGNGTHRDHLLVKRLRFLEAAQCNEHLTLEAHGVHQVFRLVLDQLVAGGNGGVQFLGVKVPVGVAERPLAQQDAFEPVAQDFRAERFDHIVVRRQLGGRNHLLVIGLGRDHHEDRPE